MRILKEPEERKAEILDAAERLFITKGYSKTTIIDILNQIGIAKGTFYYHFKSKEEVMDAIITRIVNRDAAAAKTIANNTNLSSPAKLLQILFSLKPKSGEIKEQLTEQLHHPNNAEMHQKSLVLTIKKLTPVLTQVIEQGISEKVMAVDYPYETVEMLLACAIVIFDGELFQHDAEVMARKAIAFINMTEAALKTEKGVLSDMMKLFM